MAVLLLHTPPAVVAQVRDDDGLVAEGPGWLLVRRAALTPDLMATLLRGARRRDTPVTEHPLPGGLTLRVTHDGRVLGPPGLRNLGPGGHAAPWGVWVVYRGPSLAACERVHAHEAAAAYAAVAALAAPVRPEYGLVEGARAPRRPERARFAIEGRGGLGLPPLRDGA